MSDSAPGPSHADPDVYVELAGFEGDWREGWWNHDWLALVADRLNLGVGKRVLDVGCGAGHWGRTLLRHVHSDARVVGIDREASFVQMARDQAQDKGLADRTEYVAGDATALPFDDDQFDLVTCQTVLIHVPDAVQVLAQMRRVLRPGGRIVVAEPDNVATAASFHNTSIPQTPTQRLALVELQLWCEEGKRKLGEGDNSVGAHLPAMFAEAGLQDIAAYASDKCAMQLPPYTDPTMAIDLREHLRFAKIDCWMQTGTRDDSRRLFLAGGGDAKRFDELWADVLAWLREFESQAAARTFSGARGVMMYVVAGTKR